MLRFYSASTGAVSPKRAVAECLENAVGGTDLDCTAIIFYTTMGHDFREILNEMHRLSPRARIAGSSSAGVVGREGPNDSMRALAAMVIKGPPEEIAVAGAERITKEGSFDVSRRIAEDLKRQNPRIGMILYHPSALNVIPEKAIEGIESVFGPDVVIFGALSADNLRLASDFQFVDNRILERGAVAVGFADPTLEYLTQGTHGFSVVGEPMKVTKSAYNHVLELDGEPAFDYWRRRRVDLPPDAPPAALAFSPLARELPAALQEEYGNRYLIVAYQGSFGEDGNIHVTESCPEGTRLWLTKRDERGIFDGVDRMVGQLARRCQGRTIRAVLHADCSARGSMLFHRVLKEEIVHRTQYPLCGDRNVPWAGMYGGGEFARLGGRNRIHAYTTSLCLLLDRER